MSSPPPEDAAPVSIVIPALDEEGSIGATLTSLTRAFEREAIDYELVVVDDGSTDGTAAIAESNGAHVLRLPENRGYGAALKAGIRLARHDIIAITDADGTYPCDRLPELVRALDAHDMVVGARTGPDVEIPNVRRPAKWFLRKLASFVAGRSIPDLNSGMRVMRRDLVERFEHLLPEGFSFTSTITLAALCTGALVRFESIDYRHRVGTSKLRARHAFDFLLLILRTAVYFHPLKVFLPLGAAFLVVAIHQASFGRSEASPQIALVAELGAALIWGIGLLSDQIARVALGRRARRRRA